MTAKPTIPSPPTIAVVSATPAPPMSREKTGIPRNPGRRDLGMKATLLFPDREIVERFYVPLIYTACRTCYSELDPDEIFRRATVGEIDPDDLERWAAEGAALSLDEAVGYALGITVDELKALSEPDVD